MFRNIWPLNKLYNLADMVYKLKEENEQLKNELNDFRALYQRSSEDLWYTKYGYDWMMSDLQMAYIENIVPGNRNRLQRLKDTHTGESCFVIGSGPSLRAEDLTALKKKGFFCLAGKRVSQIFSETDWRPDVWGVSDLAYIEKYKDEIDELDGFLKLVCAQSIIRHGIQIKNAVYFPFIQVERSPRWFNADIMRGVHFFGSITCKLINIAVYMGFKTIYLLGVDNTTFCFLKQRTDGTYFTDQKAGHFACAYDTEEEHEIEVREEDVEFARKMGIYDRESYIDIKWHCDQLGVEIYNATRGGQLETFPRVLIDELIGVN